MMEIELVCRVTCDHLTGEKVFEALDQIGIESDFVYTTKRIFEVNICSHGNLDCIKCRDVFQKIHEVETGKRV